MGSVWRNRDFRRCIGLYSLLGIILLPVCFSLHTGAGAVSAGLYTVVLLLFVHYTRKRYWRIAQLSDQLARIATGNYSVDIREYAEGELSVLASEILKITSALSHQKDSLQRDKRFLSDTLADISHQLKTPLTSMAMMADLLETPELPAGKRAEFLQGIQISIQRTQWLVSSLLKLSRLDAGAVAFQSGPVDMGRLLEQAAAPLRVALEQKNQTLRLEMEQGMTVTGDCGWLAEAVGNLLKNSVDHTPEGGAIEIRCAKNPLYTEICVLDNGPGIPEQELPHIFQRFYRGKDAPPDSVGIGLALCKSIVQRQGGSVSAQNRRGGGACFTLKLYGKTVV